ncbi:hypothetical protein SteCoe_29189 [Stentor coeruleus]|uniref:Tubulin--tyrosine ligase-like protein 9 n=1 Tax=Stentor coeruleus TaxID=5963 RepID=A0A1R2B6M8_9CILI|nr:hypothetical protein SteCoe_29189 [Stentor coeruleus]
MSNIDKEHEIQTPSRRKAGKKITINIAFTQYEIIQKISQSLGWRVKSIDDDEDDSDLIWTDCSVQPEKLCKMKPYQKINHFPNMHEIARKNFLAKNLNKLRKLFPDDFSFYPKTFLYPSELSSLKLYNTSKKFYIVKPEASCQGKGIFLTKSLEGFVENERYVIQEYITNPLLIDKLKFDMRIYVLIAGCDPLKVFLHKEGLGRFATEPYSPPNSKNFHNTCMHLTNYAINKNSENFIFNSDPKNDNVGHKRSLTATMSKIQELGFDIEKIWKDISAIIVKTLCTIQPSLAHVYKACQPDDPYNGMCFEVLGFDIILDETGKPWLLEVNHSPSFNIDSPLDYKIKFQVLQQALVLLNLNPDNKREYDDRKKKQILFRTLSHNKQQEKDNKISDFKNAQLKRATWENSHIGDFTMIFPSSNPIFDNYLRASQQIWVESTGGRILNKDQRPVSQEGTSKALSSMKKNLQYSTKKNDLTVFQRLYKIKKVKIEPGPVPPCVQLDEAFKTQYFKSQTPYSFIELVIPKKIEERSRYRSFPKKRISNNHQHFEEMLKEKKFGERLAMLGGGKNTQPYETPLQICSVITDEGLFSDPQRAKFFKQLLFKKLF